MRVILQILVEMNDRKEKMVKLTKKNSQNVSIYLLSSKFILNIKK